MTEQVNFTLSLLTACVMQQNQLLTQQNAMQRELMDRMDSVGDLLWRMDLRHGITRSQVDQTGQAGGEEAPSGPQEGYLPQTRRQEGLI